MLSHKHIDKICVFTCIFSILLTIFFINGKAFGLESSAYQAGYVTKIFDDTKVHTVDIVIAQNDWDDMMENAMDKEYKLCNIVIDGEAVKNVAVRTKGNSSLSTMQNMDSDRYSLKVEFDHFEKNKSYYGLDKISFNNTIQDTTSLKDYLSYHMFNEIGVASPLSSFVWITINGEDHGLYLAAEDVEESLLARNYGTATGSLYKPEGTMGMGGGGPNNQTQEEETEKLADSATLQYLGEDQENYTTLWDGSVFDIGNAEKNRLISSLKQLSTGEDLESVLDVESVLKYFIVHNYLLNFDSYTGNMLHNYYLYDQNGILSMIPWDYNLAFGSFGGGGMGGRGNRDQAQAQENIIADENANEQDGMVQGENRQMPGDMAQGGNGQMPGAIPQDGNGQMPGNMMQQGENNEQNGGNLQMPSGENSTNNTTTMINYPIDTPLSGSTLEERPMIGQLLNQPEYLELYHQYFSEFITEYYDSGKFIEEYDRVISLITPYVEKDPTAFYEFDEFVKGYETLREFCILRFESIKGQLDGTIPATTDGQKNDSTSLIDGGTINVSDTGSMGGGGQGGFGNGQMPNIEMDENGQPVWNELNEENNMQNIPNENNEQNQNDQRGQRGQGGPMGGNMPGGNNENIQVDTKLILILTLSSCIVLIIGIIFVVNFRKNK